MVLVSILYIIKLQYKQNMRLVNIFYLTIQKLYNLISILKLHK